MSTMDLQEWQIFSHLDAHEEAEVLRVAQLLEKFEEAVEASTASTETTVQLQAHRRLSLESPTLMDEGFNDQMAPEAPITLEWAYRLIHRVRHHTAISSETAVCILKQARNVMRRLPNVTELNIASNAKVTIVGDLHGQLHDLLHVLDYVGVPASDNYIVFNGDFVDRGAHSVEVLLIIFTLFLACPGKVLLNRGNHECFYVCKFYGFYEHVKTYFNGKMTFFHEACATFKSLPIATLINDVIYVVHGGIKDGTETITDLNKAQRNLLVGKHLTEQEKKSLMAEEILEREQLQAATWSDPEPNIKPGEPPLKSPRGLGTLFGEHHVDDFMERNGVTLIVRSHQMVPEGLCDNFVHRHGVLQRSEDGEDPPILKFLTVFSASRYGHCTNKGAVIQFRHASEGQIEGTDYRRVCRSGLVMSCHQFTGDEDVGEEIENSNRMGLRECIMMNRDALSAAFAAEDPQANGFISPEAWAKVVRGKRYLQCFPSKQY